MKMRKIGFVFGLAVLFGGATQLFAQEEHYANRPYELNVNAGAHFPEDADDTDVGVGARIFMNRPSGLGFGGNFTWIISNADFDGQDFDVNTYLYSAEVEYTFGSPSQLHPFVGAGIGAATTKISDVPEGFEDSETNLHVPLAGGIKWFNRTNDPSWAIRAEIRDNIIFHGDQEFGVELPDSETSNNWEISGGISFLFGG
jgi:opacity protein-like surface antigen